MAQQGIPVIGPLLNKIIGTRNERFVKRYTARAEAINKLRESTSRLTDAEIRARVQEFRARMAKGARADDLMAEAFAIAREAMDRAVGIRNIFNPALGFDAGRLPGPARELYERVRTEIAGMPVLYPATVEAPLPAAGAVRDEGDEFLGAAAPIEPWQRVEIPPELYAAVRELLPESKPPFRAHPFDVQLIGAMVLYQGKIAEMKTGEGKTIVAPLAAYLAAIERYKVHVVTVNDYLVQRDRDWTAPFFRALGLRVGAIHPQHMQSDENKGRMYKCDVVYGTTSEFGFDYLRDNMKRSVEQQVQRRREFAIVDEVDSILIDEARTPLIISGPAHDDQPRYEMADGLARHLVEKQGPWQALDDKVTECKKRIKGLEGDIRNAKDKAKLPELQEQLREARGALPGLEREREAHTQYYELHPERKQVHLTHEGIAEAQRAAGIGSFYVDQNMDVPHLLEQSLRAHAVYQLDKDYVIMDVPDRMTGRTEPSIVIVDTFTGRPMIGRQWSDGLHQAIEAKEKVPIKQETQTVATITIQNFFKMYKRLAGMTGTADTEAQEFHDIYKLDVVSIPTNKPVIRRDYDDLMFLVAKDKWDSIVDEIKAFHDVGRPILVGTTSVEKSEKLSQMLARKHGIKHEVLNAKQHEREAHIVENAGQLGAVMIATNMAGRGTDIKLGRISREMLLDHWLRRSLCSRELTTAATTAEVRENVYRKIAPAELKEEGLAKREVEKMPFDELETKLLRKWVGKYTWVSPKRAESLTADEARAELDATGRFLLHRIDWFDTIESLGGLHVIGTERHEARRIDNQLRGRCGRQGDKGSSRFYVSLEDDLMKMFAGETTMKILARLGMKEGDAIEHPMLSKAVERAQRKVEERNFQVRKNILEYDEVMEHQRQTFYGLRQRVLEGRDVKGLVLEYLDEAVRDAAAEYLDKDFPAQCAAEYAKDRLDCSIMPDRLRGKDRHEMEKTIRQDASDDARQTIGVTLGEYMPMEGSEVSVDFDSAGLINWANSRFGVELHADQLRQGGARERANVQDLLSTAAEERIAAADLSGLDEYLAPDYGAQRLSQWAKTKFAIEVPADEIARTMLDDNPSTTPEGVIMARTREIYAKREIEYPVDFAIEMTMFLMRQAGPQAALSQLVAWANRRYSLGLSEEKVKSTPPQAIRETLLAASRTFVESGRLDEAIREALACPDDDALEAHLRDRFGATLPDWMRFQKTQEERQDAIRGRIEGVLRSELLQLEQTLLINTLDGTWKDHLYGMDQLRDSIGFRAFSQQDPRIEYKREGSRQFKSMLQSVRDRVTDDVLKVKLTPGFGGGPRPPIVPRPGARLAPPPGPPSAPPTAVPGGPGRSTGISGSFSGPGIDGA